MRPSWRYRELRSQVRQLERRVRQLETDLTTTECLYRAAVDRNAVLVRREKERKS